MVVKPQTFEAIADRYDDSRTVIPASLLARGISKILEVDPAGASRQKVLDGGAGTGQISLAFLQLGFQVTGVDLSSRMLSHAVTRCGLQSSFRAIQGDISNLPFLDKSFDVVVSHHTFDHVPAWHRALEEIQRVLRPGKNAIFIFTPGLMRSTPRSLFMKLASERGFRIGTAGAHKKQLYRYLETQGHHLEVVQDPERLSWVVERPLKQTLTEIKARAYAPFWQVPDNHYDNIVEEIEESIRSDMMNNVVERRLAYLEFWQVTFNGGKT